MKLERSADEYRLDGGIGQHLWVRGERSAAKFGDGVSRFRRIATANCRNQGAPRSGDSGENCATSSGIDADDANTKPGCHEWLTRGQPPLNRADELGNGHPFLGHAIPI